MSDEREWTICTEHVIGALHGECKPCHGDRNLIQVVPRSVLDAERAAHAATRKRLRKAEEALRAIDAMALSHGVSLYDARLVARVYFAAHPEPVPGE